MSVLNIILDQYGLNETEQQGIIGALEIIGCNLNIEESNSNIEALDQFDNELQKSILRPSGSERQQLGDKYAHDREQLTALLSLFINELNSGNDLPSKILLGAAEKGVRERLDIIVELDLKGYNTQIVYPLGSERELWPLHEPLAAKLVSIMSNEKIEIIDAKFNELFAKVLEMKDKRESHSDADLTKETNIARKNTVKYYTDKGITWPTEANMMHYLITQEYQKKLPNIKFIPVISAGNKLNNAGQIVRADTYDTFVEMWKIHGEEITSSLGNASSIPMSIITIQPFGHYQQQQAIKAFHNKPIETSVVAMGVDPNQVNIATIFDSLARTIYAGKEIATEKLKMLDNSNPTKDHYPENEL